MRTKLIFCNREFYCHPLFKTFAGSVDGYYFDILKQIPSIGTMNDVGYYVLPIGSYKMPMHEFIWECFHGLLRYDEKIFHINKNRYDNRLQNLRLESLV